MSPSATAPPTLTRRPAPRRAPRRGRALGCALVLLLLAAGCSDGGGGDTSRTADTSAPEPIADEPEALAITYVQHALLGSTITDEEGTRLILNGVDQVTPWFSDEGAGVLSTQAFIEQWEALGLADQPPQAALVPADPLQPAVVVELTEPSWDAGQRLLGYDVRVVAEPSSRLDGMIGDVDGILPEQFSVATLFIDQPEAPSLPEGGPTTTTTTIPAPPPDATATTPPPSDPGTGQPSATPTSPSPTPAPTNPQAPGTSLPSGPSVIVASPLDLAFPVAGGVDSFVLTNVGSGVGSWSATPQQGTGMSITPSSGFLLPGSSVTVQVVYNGRGPNPDFGASIQVFASSGNFQISVLVG